EVLGSAIQQAHLAQSVTLAGPFSGHGMSRLADAGHSSPSFAYSLREGAWTREFRVTHPARVCAESQHVALFMVNLAQARLQDLLKLSTLSADLAHLVHDQPHEDAESGLRRGLVRSLEWAIERAQVHSTAIAVFQVELADEASERERLELTALLRSSLRKMDQVVRLNPERTVILLEGLTQPDSIARIEERLKLRFDSQSIAFWSGVAVFPCHARTPERLLGLSERALNEARILSVWGFYHYGTALPEAWKDNA
ncbi:MAG: hypothetical protein RLY30_1, partial [Pseudomonadota bacterium]